MMNPKKCLLCLKYKELNKCILCKVMNVYEAKIIKKLQFKTDFFIIYSEHTFKVMEFKNGEYIIMNYHEYIHDLIHNKLEKDIKEFNPKFVIWVQTSEDKRKLGKIFIQNVFPLLINKVELYVYQQIEKIYPKPQKSNLMYCLNKKIIIRKEDFQI